MTVQAMRFRKKILCLVGTRPNFVKIAPVVAALKQHTDVVTLLVHTGQHFDNVMSEIFIEELGLPSPDVNLKVGPLPAWKQTGRIIDALGSLLYEERPDWLVVPGDVNSTLAGAIAGIRTGCRVAHLESGLRSFDRSMPEELNRIATDHLADLLFVTEPSGQRNLQQEGIPLDRMHFVGNTMIDTLLRLREMARDRDLSRFGMEGDEPYMLVTMHRPATVDHEQGLGKLFAMLSHAVAKGRVIFPVHPRTRKKMLQYNMMEAFAGLPSLTLLEPLGYLDFLAGMMRARVVLTDSGGIQEETTVLGVHCMTVREHTERPVTCEIGTNHLTGTAPERVMRMLDVLWEQEPSGSIPEGWDGHAAVRVAGILLKAEKHTR